MIQTIHGCFIISYRRKLAAWINRTETREKMDWRINIIAKERGLKNGYRKL